jgi:hypothetical protein
MTEADFVGLFNKKADAAHTQLFLGKLNELRHVRF